MDQTIAKIHDLLYSLALRRFAELAAVVNMVPRRCSIVREGPLRAPAVPTAGSMFARGFELQKPSGRAGGDKRKEVAKAKALWTLASGMLLATAALISRRPRWADVMPSPGIEGWR